ncbi:MAG: S8 family serine peptidase, partial [Rhodoglobus sp.]
TIPGYEATATLGDGEAFAGASITVNLDPTADPITGALVNSTAVALVGATDPNLCAPGSLDPALVQPDTVIVCERGVYDRVAKSAEVARVGGVGMILVNRTPGSTDTDTHSVPTIHLDAQYHDALVAYAATPGATVSMKTGNSTDYTPPTPQVAGFSSRGPVLADGSDLLKPDITAPGVSILAAGPNQEGGTPTYQFLSGTSMATPHIAGLAALYLGERPNATPAEIKSAMMTTAYDTKDGAGNAVTDPFAQGAGHVDPTKFFNPGLLYLNDVYDWAAYLQALGYDFGVDPVDPSNLNLASIAIGSLTAPETVTRTVTATQAGTFDASIEGLAGIDAVVEPSTFTVAAGDAVTFTVTFTRTDAPLDEFATGALVWTSGDTIVRSPIAVQPVTIVAPHNAEGTGTTGAVDVTVTPGGNGDIPLSTNGLSAGVLLPDPTGTETEHSGSGITGDGATYTATVAEGAEFARFDLNSTDDTADLDLIVYELDADGNRVAGWQSATSSADERVDLVAPDAATYEILVDVFSAATPTTWDMTVTSVVPGGAPLTLTPAVLPGVQGTPVTYTASWAGLAPFTTYLGLVNYADTGAFTAVQVVTGEVVVPGAPLNTTLPVISGKPDVGKKLTASPGEWDTDGLTFSYQWQADGTDIPGASHSTYKVRSADQGKTITVVVTATKGDLPPGSATSDGVVIRFVSTTKLTVSTHVAFSWQRVGTKITVTSASGDAPTGTITLTVNKRTFEVPLVTGADGKVSFTLPKLGSGLYKIQAAYGGSDEIAGSESASTIVWVVF